MVAGLVGVIAVFVVAIYAWPLREKALGKQPYVDMSYEQAVSRANAIAQSEAVENSPIDTDCRSILKLHGSKTAKSVVLFHGYTGCPKQFKELANVLYDQGYNVYVPLAPKHGIFTGRIIPERRDLIAYANESISIGKALGMSNGVIGISGGAVLAQWAAMYRPDAAQKLMIMSPFYEPSVAQAPKWQIKPLLTLIGQWRLADVNQGDYATYHGLSQYLLIAKNYPSTPISTPSTVILSDADPDIDLPLAKSFSAQLLSGRTLYYVPATWKVKHDIASATELKEFTGQAASDYARLYDGLMPEYLEQQH